MKKPKPKRDPLALYTSIEPITLSGVAKDRIEQQAGGRRLCHVYSEILERSTLKQRGAEEYPERPNL